MYREQENLSRTEESVSRTEKNYIGTGETHIKHRRKNTRCKRFRRQKVFLPEVPEVWFWNGDFPLPFSKQSQTYPDALNLHPTRISLGEGGFPRIEALFSLATSSLLISNSISGVPRIVCGSSDKAIFWESGYSLMHFLSCFHRESICHMLQLIGSASGPTLQRGNTRICNTTCDQNLCLEKFLHRGQKCLCREPKFSYQEEKFLDRGRDMFIKYWYLCKERKIYIESGCSQLGSPRFFVQKVKRLAGFVFTQEP